MSPHAATAAIAEPRRGLYPEIQPYRTGHLRVSPLHEIYYEECGNPGGQPVVFVHGGPGGGSDPAARRFFDPARYRIVLFDQRGCGLSRPHAELTDNTTWNLVEDMERLRVLLGIERWLVFGGSWGSTLALVYAECHPQRVRALVLRGIFMLRPAEIAWFYQHGASEIWPDRWEEYLAPIPAAERGNLLDAYYRRLTGTDRTLALAAARAWSIWEGATSHLIESERTVSRFGGDEFALALARIEAHYFTNGGFFDVPDQILRDVHRLRGIPAVIVQGRYDVVCPMTSAWDLHRAWPEADFRVVPDAGHSAFEPGIIHELVQATDRYASP
jgi:proline iminopeptidase